MSFYCKFIILDTFSQILAIILETAKKASIYIFPDYAEVNVKWY